jgi:hypothetical protein
MNELDYSSPERFYDKMESYMEEAKKNGFVKEGTIFLFPEHIGTPLVLLGEKKTVYAANSISSALTQIAIGNLFGYFNTYLASTNQKNRGEIIFKMKADEMKSTYENTFRKLSTLYGVTIIAGSILLPTSEINPETNKIQLKNGSIFNSSFIFLLDGKIFPKIGIKHNLAKTERLVAVSQNSKDVFLEFNKSGIILSNDSLYSSMYGEKSKNMEILLSPSALLENDEIDWKNIDIYGSKEILDTSLTQTELWRKYSIFEKTKTSQANRIVIQVFLLGKFFDLTLEGESSGMIRYVASEGLDNKNPAILNVWF